MNRVLLYNIKNIIGSVVIVSLFIAFFYFLISACIGSGPLITITKTTTIRYGGEHEKKE